MAGPTEKVEFVLFMSPNCNFCNKFMHKLKTKPELMKKINIVNIDALEVVPDEVDEVPCVYDGKAVYQGAPAFKWLDEKLSEFLDAANDGLAYAFLDGQDERVFGGYSLLEQNNFAINLIHLLLMRMQVDHNQTVLLVRCVSQKME